MRIGLRFGVGPLRVYVPLASSRKRKRRRGSPSRTRTSAPRGTASKPGFHGTVPMPDGSVYQCHHAHRTEQAAIECAQKYICANFPQTHSPTRPRRMAPIPRNNITAEAPKPPQWWPRAGWGTVRRFARNGEGFRFYWVPDDGSQPQLFELPGVPARELGEYARGVMQGDNFTIKVSAKSMAEVAQTFQRINQMDLSKRKVIFADRTDLDGDAGWTWTPDYTLVPVAPGLLN
jgi:hypothetical protein